jgi:hypothetical protein
MKNHKNNGHQDDLTPKDQHNNGSTPHKHTEEGKNGSMPNKPADHSKDTVHPNKSADEHGSHNGGEKNKYFGNPEYKKSSCDKCDDTECNCKGNDCNNKDCKCGNCHCK